jgi:prepilin-type N-terminal cleavage/methylation domain-containing protein
MWAIGNLPPARASFADKSAGFTLIETLVTIGVMALVAGIVFPSIDRARWTARRSASAVDRR